MNYNIHLENFDGPMDLLLHLVKETKLDIYEISMTDIIEGYLNALHHLQDLNINVGSEFILMSSSLIHLKSKMLIGKTVIAEENEDDYNITSEEDLKNRIIEYEKYKNITSYLKELENKRSEVHTKVPSKPEEYNSLSKVLNESGLEVSDLVNALKNVLERYHYKEPLETKITKKELNLKARVEDIRRILKEKKRVDFMDLFEVKSKEEVIITFLAILEMSKQNEIKFHQNNNFDRIIVEEI